MGLLSIFFRNRPVFGSRTTLNKKCHQDDNLEYFTWFSRRLAED